MATGIADFARANVWGEPHKPPEAFQINSSFTQIIFKPRLWVQLEVNTEMSPPPPRRGLSRAANCKDRFLGISAMQVACARITPKLKHAMIAYHITNVSDEWVHIKCWWCQGKLQIQNMAISTSFSDN